MDREIVLSSYSVKEIPFNKPENFVTKFTRPIILQSNNEYQLGLNRIINMSFTWFNVNPLCKNHIASIIDQTFKISRFQLVYGITTILIAISTNNKERRYIIEI